MSQFEMKVSPIMKPLLWLFGAGAGKRCVTVDDGRITIRMGRTEFQVPIDEVATVEATRWPMLYGLGPGRVAPNQTLGVVASSQGAVNIALRRPLPFKVPFRLERKNLVVALDNPAGFIEAVEQARA